MVQFWGIRLRPFTNPTDRQTKLLVEQPEGHWKECVLGLGGDEIL